MLVANAQRRPRFLGLIGWFRPTIAERAPLATNRSDTIIHPAERPVDPDEWPEWMGYHPDIQRLLR